MALNANALIDLQSVKDELGYTDTTYDAMLTGRINRVSSAIERYCNKNFLIGYVTETAPGPIVRSPRLQLKRDPVWAVQSITQDAQVQPTIVNPTVYQLESSRTGWIYRAARWATTAIRRPDIVQDFQPNTEQESTLIKYIGGYITTNMAQTGAAWPGATQTVKVGTILKVLPSGYLSPNEQVWMSYITPDSVGTDSGVTGSTSPTWPSPATAPQQAVLGAQGIIPGVTIVDGTVTWIYMGTAGSVGTGLAGTAVTLPDDIVGAALDCIVSSWASRGQDTNVKSESISGIASVSYGDRNLFPPTAQAIIDRYRRFIVA
jgi:hypothetical protein